MNFKKMFDMNLYLSKVIKAIWSLSKKIMEGNQYGNCKYN